MMAPEPHDPLHRWFAGLVESSFQEEVGFADPSVLDYLTQLLTDFIHIERINSLRDGSGRAVEDVAEMMVEAEGVKLSTSDERRREYHRHIGDFTLFWIGVYPENLKQMHHRKSRDDLLDYFSQGKRSYAIASRLTQANMDPPGTVLQALSDRFECCVYGLGLVRKRWEHSDGGPNLLLS